MRDTLSHPGADKNNSPLRSPADPVPTRVADLRPGLLIFFSRPSLLQTWAELFGHQWRHVGITVQTNEGLRVASYCIKKCFRLDDPTEIMAAYDRVGVARIFQSAPEQHEFERFCRRFEFLERSDSPYATSSIVIGPIHMLARRRPPGLLRTTLLEMIRRYCLLQRWRYRDRSSFVCSTFAWEAIVTARSRPLRVPLSAHPDDEAAYATPTTETDELLARWLCGPTEIWHAISTVDRADLDLGPEPLPPCSRVKRGQGGRRAVYALASTLMRLVK